jgi:transposase
LKKEGIHLNRQRSWCISTDKEFAAKAADIVGLYLSPPMNAIVICVDEKPSIQALERKTGYIQTGNKQLVRGVKSTYKRNGTINLFAALEVATGIVNAKTTKTKTREDFIQYMDELVLEYGTEKELHVILDNYCTHKKNDKWLESNKNVTFHYTPTSASWLNLVEVWFGIFTRKSLNGASFDSTSKLSEHIHAYVKAVNENPVPFIWKKREVKGSQLKNNIVNFRN